MRIQNASRWILSCSLLGLALSGTLLGQATEKTLINFSGTNGAAPWGGVIQASDGNFYGATFEGGANGTGTIYRVANGSVTSLYSFPASGEMTFPAANLVEGQDGNLYGVACGNNQPTNSASTFGALYKVTSFSSATPSVTTVFDFTGTAGTNPGTCPLGALVQDVNGVFYGTTFGGGAEDYGTVYTYNPATSAFKNLYTFSGGADGGNPFSGVIQGSNGNLFGTASAGGNDADCPSTGNPAIGCGVIYRVSPGGEFLVLHTFDSTDGAVPTTQLVEGSDRRLYGTTCAGGANTDGVLFNLMPNGKKSVYTKLVDLTQQNGQNCTMAGPEIGPLFLAGDGNFYGSLFGGGTDSLGSVFSYTPGASGVNTVYSFNSGTGQQPYTGPFEGADGNFYGPTIAGGTSGAGTIYELTPDTAVAPAITLTSSASNPTAGTSFTLTWDVTNAFSKTAALCYASSSSGTFTGKKSKSGSETITENTNGVVTYAFTCGGVESATVTVTIGPLPPTIILSSAGHNFGAVAEGSSAKYGIKLTNSGTTAFPFSITLSGDPSFTEQDNCAPSVAAGASCEIIFTYTAPATSGYQNATFTIAADGQTFNPSNSGNLLAHSVQAGVITVNAIKHNFVGVPFGQSAQFGWIISNGSAQTVPLTFTTSGDTADFAVQNNCSATLASETQCTVIFTYTPSSTSYQTFNDTISTGASGVAVQPGNTLTLLGYGTP